MINPLFSVITVVYNDEVHIEETIKSVIAQDYSNIEYIIIDGKSIDKTCHIINKYTQHLSIFISERDCGVYDAMNKALSYIQGDWVIFMNSGDLFYSDKVLTELSAQINFEYDVFYGDTLYRYTSKDVMIKAKSFSNIKYSLPFCHQSALVKASIFKKYNFNLKYKIASDYNLFYTLHQNNFKFKYIKQPIAIYSFEGGLSSSNIVRLHKELSIINNTIHGGRYYRILLYLYLRMLIFRILKQSSIFSNIFRTMQHLNKSSFYPKKQKDER